MSHILLLKSLKSPCFAPSGSWVVAHPLQTRARAPETKLRWRSAGLVRVSNKTLQNARKMELSRDWMITKMLMWATEVGMQSTTTVTMETYIIVKTHFKLWASFPLQKSAWVLFRQSLAGSAGALFLSWLWSSDLHGRMLRNNAKHSPKIHPQNHHLLVYFATSRWEAIQNLSILPPVSDQDGGAGVPSKFGHPCCLKHASLWVSIL